MKLSISATKLIFPIINIWQGSFDEVVSDIEKYLRKDHGINKLIFTPNLDHLRLLAKDIEFQNYYSQANWIVPDGMSLVWLSMLTGYPLRERINGTNLMTKLIEVCNQNNLKIFFLGSTKSVLKKLSKNLKKQYPDLMFSIYAPPFRKKYDFNNKTTKTAINKINNFKTDLLLVGLGIPKQEHFLAKNKAKLKIRVGMGVGGAFLFLSKTEKRAPVWLQKIGGEWLFRLAQDPARLSKRYLLQDLPFFIQLATKLAINKLNLT